MSDGDELIVLSHLRWIFVWQRPQHLISRLAGDRRTWFVEEPLRCGAAEPTLRTEDHDGITRVWLELPGEDPITGFDHPAAAAVYGDLLAEAIGPAAGRRTVWLYTPMAMPLAAQLEPDTLVYDVMDDLASFKHASPELRLRQKRALREADLVFTGGRSLHEGVRDRTGGRCHLFPSGVDPSHYAPARRLRRESARDRPVAGYVGVIDERLDLDLVAGLADALPEWDVEMVGPVVKIDPGSLPQRPNLRYPGMKSYDELPAVMGGFDVALMPFALNEATRSISPTKTLEYLAAGLPVVSTPVPDVVASHSEVVDIRADAEAFADACRAALADGIGARAAAIRALLNQNTWDTIASRMSALIIEAEETRWTTTRAS